MMHPSCGCAEGTLRNRKFLPKPYQLAYEPLQAAARGLILSPSPGHLSSVSPVGFTVIGPDRGGPKRKFSVERNLSWTPENTLIVVCTLFA